MEPARDKPPRLPTRSSHLSSSALMGTTMPRRPFEGGSGFPLSSSFMDFGAPPSASEPRPSSPLEPKIEPFGEILDFSPQPPPPVGYKLPSSSSSSSGVAAPRPLEDLQSAPIPPFLSKTYELVDDPSLDPLISWGYAGRSFVVWDPVEFARAVLPQNFKHNNFSSFVRQLNTYGFRKIDSDRWEFANEDFVRGNKPLLKYINRRRSSQVQQVGSQVGFSAENAKPELEGELHVLRKEKSTLMQEVIKLQQEHLMTVQQMDALNQQMQSAGQRQKLMVSFLAKVLQHPVLLAHLKQLNEQREIASTVRRRFLKQQQRSHSDLDKAMDQQTGKKRLEFIGATSSGLQGIECNVSNQLPDNQDMVEKLGLDTSRGELLRGSVETGLEVLDPLFLDPDSVAIKVELPESSQTDMGFSGTEFFASFPEDVTPERMFSDAIIPATEFARPDPKTVSFEGKNAVDKTEVTSVGSMCLGSFAADTSQKKMFSDAIASASKTSSSQEEIWNVSLEAGESSWSSCQHVWDSLAQDAIELEVAAGPGALWDIDLQTLDEDLEFDKCLGSDFPHQERESQAGPANKDHKEKMEP